MVEQGKVTIPSGYFLKMAKHDYENYEVALPREFYQNSIDAGATRIDVITEDRSITVKDNGCGMSRDVLVNKLLVLGGSHKAEGAVGAFGKAKELLFFSWNSYSIRTGNLLVIGKGADYTITEAEHVKGTECIIEMDSASSAVQHFHNVASKIQTKTRIAVDGHDIDCLVKRGPNKINVEGVGVIYQLKKEDSQYMAVRINGIWMFDQYVGNGVGTLVLELSDESTKVLTSNRDGLKWDYRSKVARLVSDLNVNKMQALQKEKNKESTTIPGTGPITVGEPQLALAKAKIEAGHNLMGVLDQVFVNANQEQLNAIQEYRIKNAGRVTKVDWEEFSQMIEFIGYEPDFTLIYDGGKREKVAKFMTTKKARLLASMWTEMLKQIMIDNKMYLRFTAGFIFDKDMEAGIQDGDGFTKICLNPDAISISEHRFCVMEDLKDLAIHELAHLRVRDHNNDFVNEMAEIRRKVTRSDQKAYTRIQMTRIK